MEKGIIIKIGEKEEIWKLCKKNHSYCPTHGKCADILDEERSSGNFNWEFTKECGIEGLFYCKKCKMIKMVNLWNNCVGFTEVLREVELPPLSSPSLKPGVSRGAD